MLLNGDSTCDTQRVGLGSIELVLLGLGSSSTTAVLHTLRTSKIDIRECCTRVSVIPDDSDLTDLKTILIHFDFFGTELSDSYLNRAVAIGIAKYCPVSTMLRRADVTIKHTITLHTSNVVSQSSTAIANSKLTTLGLHHVALTSLNYEASRQFYTNIMKMQVEWEPDENNVYLTNGTDNLAIHRGTSEDSKLDHIGFILESKEQVDRWYSYLTNNHVHIDKEPKTHRDGARSFYLIDPDGVRVQLIYHPPLSNAASKS